MSTRFSFKKISEQFNTFTCFDDIQHVIDGIKPQHEIWIKTTDYSFGLGNGAFDNIHGIGESIIINGVAYAKSTNHDSPNYYQVVSGARCLTSWMFVLQKNPTPQFNMTHTHTGQHPLRLVDVYQIIHDRLKKPFVVTGVIHFSNLQGTAIAKAPIENENIFEHKDIYYPSTMDLAQVTGALVGVVADIPSITDPMLLEALKKVVYYNPLDATTGSLTTHEHVLLLKQPVTSMEAVVPDNASDVEHLFSQSTLLGFNLNVYILENITLI